MKAFQTYPNPQELALAKFRHSSLNGEDLRTDIGSFVCEIGVSGFGLTDRMKVCGLRFKTIHALKLHQLDHSSTFRKNSTRLLQCEDCPRQFRFLHELDFHRRSHLKEISYSCSLCEDSPTRNKQGFRFREQLVDHLRDCHPDRREEASREVEKLWRQRQWAAPDNGVQAYAQSRKQYNSQDSDGEPREQNPITRTFKCRFCGRKFSVFHSKINHEMKFCHTRWYMRAGRTAKAAEGPLFIDDPREVEVPFGTRKRILPIGGKLRRYLEDFSEATKVIKTTTVSQVLAIEDGSSRKETVSLSEDSEEVELVVGNIGKREVWKAAVQQGDSTEPANEAIEVTAQVSPKPSSKPSSSFRELPTSRVILLGETTLEKSSPSKTAASQPTSKPQFLILSDEDLELEPGQLVDLDIYSEPQV